MMLQEFDLSLEVVKETTEHSEVAESGSASSSSLVDHVLLVM